jgi:hypothetical protein
MHGLMSIKFTNTDSSAIHKPDVYATHNIMSRLLDILKRYVYRQICSVHAIKTLKGSSGIAPLGLNLGA